MGLAVLCAGLGNLKRKRPHLLRLQEAGEDVVPKRERTPEMNTRWAQAPAGVHEGRIHLASLPAVASICLICLICLACSSPSNAIRLGWPKLFWANSDIGLVHWCIGW